MDEKTLQDKQIEDELRSGRTTDASVPPGARQFPCVNCGGPLVFMPGTTHLKCPYCGTENDIPLDADDDSYLRENDFLEALEAENQHQEDTTPGPVRDVIRCTYCGANTTVNERKSSDLCPYCGHPLSLQNLTRTRLNVQAVLPFQIAEEKALIIYRNWVKTRWFAPNNFKRRVTRGEAMRGCYMPYWTYDAVTTTWYTGQRGTVYYVTQMVPVTVNGKTTMQPRQVPKSRWTPSSGRVQNTFDDILVPAAQSVPMNIQSGLQPWNLQKLQPFRQEFLAGFVTETYQVGLKDGFETAKQLMEPAIRQTIVRDIGGDQQRISSTRSEYANITFKHILLPIWLSAYAYGGKTYRFTINAQTGEVSGDRPYSVWKIALAILAGLIVLGLVYYFLGDGDGGGMGYYESYSVVALGMWSRFRAIWRRGSGFFKRRPVVENSAVTQ
ncbi:MAG: primosomal protein N' (replication factor Y) - superfamily II helicase [Planctomycetes bacterium]|nr:primosomal protein N' (replication factor Y) - superfamily II helicase [Planctomycetota bacterium]